MDNIFEYNNIANELNNIKDKIKAEYKHIRISTLGGKDKASIIIYISLDKKEDWVNGIFHNSRYYIIHIDYIGVVECFSCHSSVKKLRKKTVKNLNKAIDYINKNIKKEVLSV